MAWLGTWKKRVEITLDSAAVLTAALSNFPVAIMITSSSGIGAEDLTPIFDELGASSLKLAVTTSDGTTQCYVEVAYWNDSTEVGTLWVKVPSVSDSSDTVLYLYYDSDQTDNTTYVGVVGSSPAQAVWTEGYAAVYHLNEDPTGGAGCIKDSLATYDGTPRGSWSSGQLVDGPLDKALDFQAAHAVDVGDSFDSLMAGATGLFSHEFICNFDTLSTQAILAKYYSAGDQRGHVLRLDLSTFYRIMFHYEDRLLDDRRSLGGSSTIATGTWYHICSTYDASIGTGGNGADRVKLYLNGSNETLTVVSASGSVSDIDDNTAHMGFGSYLDTSGGLFPTQRLDGKIAEIRFSSVSRTREWADASYRAAMDTFVTYGTPTTRVVFSDTSDIAIASYDLFVNLPFRVHFLSTPNVTIQAYAVALTLLNLHVPLDSINVSISAYDFSLSGIPIPAGTKAGDLSFYIKRPYGSFASTAPLIRGISFLKPLAQWAGIAPTSTWAGAKPTAIFDTEGE